jgi:hypothetical protein
MGKINFDNIKHFDFYNSCNICHKTKNLSECNLCIELYCITCDKFKKDCCILCYNRFYCKCKSCLKSQ